MKSSKLNPAISPTSQTTRSVWITHPLLWAAALITPNLASAESECAQDSDCQPHERCESVGTAVGGTCSLDENGEEVCTEDVEEVVSFCVEAPILCETNSDCPSHLRCGSPRNTPTPTEVAEPADREESTEPSPPEMSVPEEMEVPDADLPPPEEEEMMCLFVPVECEADSDCAENFRCEQFSIEPDCAFIAAPVECDEEGCPDPVIEPECDQVEEVTEGICVPEEIECDQGQACPADWHCQDIITVQCEDGGTDDIAVEAPEDDPQGADREADTDEPIEDPSLAPTPCEEQIRSLCVPVGFGDGIAGSSAEFDGNGTDVPPVDAEPDSEEDNPSEDEQRVDEDGADDSASGNADLEDEGGCSARPSGAQPWALFGLLALFGLRRRALVA